MAIGDLVVHVDHGIGRFIGLKAIEVGGAPHDCVEIEYAGGKLYLRLNEAVACYDLSKEAYPAPETPAPPASPAAK